MPHGREVIEVMPKGFDTTADCGPLAPQIKAAGYDFVARYYAHRGTKRLSAAEARQLSAAGLHIVVVWEDAPTEVGYFSRARGVDDGTHAYDSAVALGQPAGSAIYFAVDYDALPAAIAGVVADYFRGVRDGFAHRSSGQDPAYRIGVYGSGAACKFLREQGLAELSWLAQSTGWAGYHTYADWNIKQGATTQALGIEIDPDTAKDDYGGFALGDGSA